MYNFVLRCSPQRKHAISRVRNLIAVPYICTLTEVFRVGVRYSTAGQVSGTPSYTENTTRRRGVSYVFRHTHTAATHMPGVDDAEHPLTVVRARCLQVGRLAHAPGYARVWVCLRRKRVFRKVCDTAVVVVGMLGDSPHSIIIPSYVIARSYVSSTVASCTYIYISHICMNERIPEICPASPHHTTSSWSTQHPPPRLSQARLIGWFPHACDRYRPTSYNK